MFVKFIMFLRGTRGSYPPHGWLQVRKIRFSPIISPTLIVGMPSTLNAILYFADTRRRGPRAVPFLSLASPLRSPQCRFQWQASICRNYYVYLPHSLKSAHRSGSSPCSLFRAAANRKASIIGHSRLSSPLSHIRFTPLISFFPLI